MSVKNRIKTLLQEADIYRSQGLLEEAKAKYATAGKLIQKNEKLITNKKKVLTGIARKIREVKAEIERLDNAPTTVVMSKDVQDIIRDKFAFAKDKNASALEGAIALAKFGQFERALQEFENLIERKPIRLEAAKNIIRCHKVLETVEVAAERYKEWITTTLFTSGQLEKLRIFLQDIINKKNLDIVLPEKKHEKTKKPPKPVAETAEVLEELTPLPESEEPPGQDISAPTIEMPEEKDESEPAGEDAAVQEDISAPTIEMPEELEMPDNEEEGIPAPDMAEAGIPLPDAEEGGIAMPDVESESAEEDDEEDDEDFDAIPEEDILDISSVEITMTRGPRKDESIELDVCFQSGNVINLLISGDEKDLIDTLKAGVKLKKLRFFSPIAMFQGRGMVSSSTMIEAGPKKGDYSLDIQIKTT